MEEFAKKKKLKHDYTFGKKWKMVTGIDHRFATDKNATMIILNSTSAGQCLENQEFEDYNIMDIA